MDENLCSFFITILSKIYGLLFTHYTVTFEVIIFNNIKKKSNEIAFNYNYSAIGFGHVL